MVPEARGWKSGCQDSKGSSEQPLLGFQVSTFLLDPHMGEVQRGGRRSLPFLQRALIPAWRLYPNDLLSL